MIHNARDFAEELKKKFKYIRIWGLTRDALLAILLEKVMNQLEEQFSVLFFLV
jgi:hypothetical protein